MKYVSINRTGMTYFSAKATVSEFSGSSKWGMIGGELYQKTASEPNTHEHNTAGLEIDIQRWLHLKDEVAAEELAIWIDHQENELKSQKNRPRKNVKSQIKKPN